MSKRNVFSVILFIFTFLWPLLSNNFDIEYDRLSQMNRCFEDRQIPCRWIPESVFGYGSPLFNYLPPLPYYLGELIYSITKNLNLSTSLMYLVPVLVTLLFFWTFIRLKQNVDVSNMLLFAISIFSLLTSNNLFSIIFLSGVLGWISFYYLKVKKRKILIYFLYSAITGVLLSSFYLLPAIFEINFIHSIKVNGETQDFLPIYSQELPKEDAKEKFQILTGDSDVFDFKQGSNNFSFKTNTKTHTIIRISQHYFPNWKILVDGKETNIEYKNNSLGLMTIILGEGEHIISGRLFDTPIRIISNVVTLTTVLFILILFLYQQSWVKRWLAYYKKGIGH